MRKGENASFPALLEGIDDAVMGRDYFLQSTEDYVNGFYTRHFHACAPELNPDGQIWTVLKYQELSNWCPDTVEEMKISVKGAMSRLKRHPEKIKNAMAHSRLSLPSIRVWWL